MVQPDSRAVALAEGTTPNGPLEEGLVALLQGKEAPVEVSYAKDIYEDPYKSEVLEAFLLAEAPPELIAKTLRVPVAVTQAYGALFFNRSVFRDELDVEAYAQNYPDTTKEQKWGRELKLGALTLGIDYLTYRFGKKSDDLDIAGSLRTMIQNAYMLSKAVRMNPMNSDSAREARQWAATAVKAMEAYVKVKPATENTDDAFTIALENIERATNEAKSGISKADIVH